MKDLITHGKKICAGLLILAMAFGMSFSEPKTVQAQTKYWI